MLTPVIVAAVVGWGGGPSAEPRCPAPAPCVCVCQLAAAAASAPPPSRTSPPSPRTLALPPGLPAAPRGADSAQPAFAPGHDAAAARAEPRRSYAGPVVAVDVLSVGAMLGALSTGGAELLLLGGAGYTLGAPINHLAHGHPGRAAASFGIRAAAFGLATGAIIEDVLAHHCDGDVNPCGPPAGGIALGALVALGAAALDDVLLAREPESRAVRPTAAQLTPGLAVGPRTASLSLAGRF
jgi:hypothetical protein